MIKISLFLGRNDLLIPFARLFSDELVKLSEPVPTGMRERER